MPFSCFAPLNCVQAPSMACDRECGLQQRKSQLADAFGVHDAASHVSYFDRHRTPAYSAALIQVCHWVITPPHITLVVLLLLLHHMLSSKQH